LSAPPSRKQRAAIAREHLAGDQGVANRESSIAPGVMLGATSKTRWTPLFELFTLHEKTKRAPRAGFAIGDVNP
jgi:hypothetical protein